MNNTTLIIGGFTWDVRSRKLERINAGTLADNDASDDKELSLTPKQFRLLHCLFHAHPNVLQRQDIIDFVWESKPTSPESLPQLINRTRSALEDSSKNILVNQPGIGYSLNFTLLNDKNVSVDSEHREDIEEIDLEAPEGLISAVTKPIVSSTDPLKLSVKLMLPLFIILTAINVCSALEATFYSYQFRQAFTAEPYPYLNQINDNEISVTVDSNECIYTKDTQLLKCS